MMFYHLRRRGEGAPAWRRAEPHASDADQRVLARVRVLSPASRRASPARHAGARGSGHDLHGGATRGPGSGPVSHLGRSRSRGARHGPHAGDPRHPPASRAIHRLHPHQAAPRGREAQVEQATRLANRVSINLEAPADAMCARSRATRTSRATSCPSSSRQAGWSGAALERRPGTPRPAGTTTQFVVGGATSATRRSSASSSAWNGRGCCTTPTSAPSSRSQLRRWTDGDRRPTCASSGSTRPST